MGKIGKALIEHDILWLTIAVYSGGVLTEFFQALIGDILYPIFAYIAGSDVNSVSQSEIILGSNKIKYGDFIKKIFSLVFNIFLIWLFVKLISRI